MSIGLYRVPDAEAEKLFLTEKERSYISISVWARPTPSAERYWLIRAKQERGLCWQEAIG